MHFLPQNYQPQPVTYSQPQTKTLSIHYQENHKNEIHSLKFGSQISHLQIHLLSPESSQKPAKIQDLIDQVSKIPKTQIISSAKLFIQLGFRLSLEPHKIAEITIDKRFVSNFTQFAKILKENRDSEDQNQKKVNTMILNSLLYMLMLLVCGQKESHKNTEFKQKVFSSKAFLKNFLGISIYKHPKFSKLYGIIIVHIYKQNPSFDVKKCLVESILRNLKHIEHEKTTLNLTMILNQLKFSYKIREFVARQQNLLSKIWGIFCQNQSKYQSVYALSYFLYLVQEFPGLSKISSSEIGKSFEITENVKNFTLTSRFFERTFKKFFQWSVHHLNPTDTFYVGNQFLCLIKQASEQQPSLKNDLSKNQKWINFLIDMTQIFVQLTSQNQTLLSIIENGLFDILVQTLKNSLKDSIQKNKIYEVLQECLNKVKLMSSRIYQSFLSTLLGQLNEIVHTSDELTSHRNKIIAKMEIQNKKLSACPMELE